MFDDHTLVFVRRTVRRDHAASTKTLNSLTHASVESVQSSNQEESGTVNASLDNKHENLPRHDDHDVVMIKNGIIVIILFSAPPCRTLMTGGSFPLPPDLLTASNIELLR